MRSRLRLEVPLAIFMVAFACAQIFPSTSSSFTDTTANAGNTVTAGDWTGPVVASTVVQKSQGGIVDKIRGDGRFYVYANVTDTSGATVTASVGNIATTSSAAMSSGSWTVGDTTYNYRTGELTAKNTLSNASYSLSVSATDGVNTPSTVSDTVNAITSTTAHNPTSYVTTNVAYAGKAWAGDKLAYTFSNAPDPESLFPGWDGTSPYTTDVQLTDGAVYGWSGSTQDVIGPVLPSGDVTPLGYVVTGGNYVSSYRTVTFVDSTVRLSGNVYTITLGTADYSGYLLTDSYSRVATWTSYATLFNAWGRLSSAATYNGVARKQF